MHRYINTSGNVRIQGINVIKKLNSNQLLLGADNGLFLFHINTRHCERIEVHSYSLPEEIRSIFDIFQDKEGGLWIGTYYDGIHYLRPGFGFLKTFAVPESEGTVVSSMAPSADKKSIWLGMTKNGGLCKYNVKSKTFDLYTSQIDFTNVRTIYDFGNEVWLGFYSDGLVRFQPTTGRKRHYVSVEDDSTTLSHRAVYKIFKTSDGTIYVGTLWGLDIFVPRQDRFTRIEQVRETRVHDILEDHLGMIWIATYEKGLFCYDPLSGEWAQFTNDGTAGALPVNKLICLHRDKNNRLYIGTEGAGVFMYNYEDRTFSEVVKTGALPSSIINEILSDNDENLWVTASRALCRIDTKTGEVRIVDEEVPTKGGQYNNNAGCTLEDGTLFFGRTGGFIALTPSLLKKNETPPDIIITNIRNAEASLSTNKDGWITINPKQNVFKADFVALSYVAPGQNKYAYYMEGLEKPWANEGYERVAVYNSLPSGKYTFHVKASNNDGVWNEQGMSIPVYVKRPFTRRPFMLVLYFLFTSGMAYMVYLFVKRNQNKRMESNMLQYRLEKEKELYEQKISFFTNIIHEIRTPLSLIKAPLESIIETLPPNDKSRENFDIMERNVERLHTLANQLLDFRKIEENVFLFHFVPSDIGEIVKNASYRFQSICKLKGIQLTVKIPETCCVTMADTEALNKVMGNLLNNALKYAKNKIHVVLERKDKQCIIKVTNDGNDIPSEYLDKIFVPFFQVNDDQTFRRKEGSGIGLALVRHLVEKHNGRIEVESENGQTCFIVTIPYEEMQSNGRALEEDVLEDAVYFEEKEDEDFMADTEQIFEHSVLLVEDNLELLNFLTTNLGRHYNIVTAHNGKDALKRLGENRIIDVIVTDILMPVMDGIELCRAVRAEEMFCHIPIVLLTAQTDLRSKTEGLDYGADVFIEKPFSMEFLKAQIASIIKIRSQLKEVFTSSPLTPPQSIARNVGDLKFITKVNEIIMDNLAETENLIGSIALSMAVSRSSLHKKIKAISGMTPNDYIQLIRLKKAAELLSTGEYQINEIAYLVGFNTPSYFSKCFQNQFGLLPRDFASKTRDKNK